MIGDLLAATSTALVCGLLGAELLGWGGDLRRVRPSYWISRLWKGLIKPCSNGWGHDFGVIEMSAGYVHKRECSNCGALNPRQGSIAPWDVHRYV